MFVVITVLLLLMVLVTLSLYIISLRRIKVLSRQLSAAIEDAGRKTGFFSNMVHELKTPLSVVLGSVQLIEMKLRNTHQNTHQDEYVTVKLKTAEYNCYRMMRLINNLLDLSRSEAGYLELKPVNCDLGLLLEEMIGSVRPYAEKKDLELICKKPEERIIIALDIEKTERILLNLLSNAIKFTNPGGCIAVSSSLSGGRVRISVKDNGVGIPADRQADIFDRFRQSESCKSAECHGSGIGLSLVKTFVELHQGNIKVISEKDKGSEFIIDLPAKTVEALDVTACPDDVRPMADEAVKVEFSDSHTITT